MKRLTIILSALILLISVSSFTKDETVSSKIKNAFTKTFSSASDVSWKKVSGFYLASFRVNNQDLSAAYNDEGELIGASRNVLLSQLPLNITLALKNQFQDYTFDDSATEIIADGETSYYVKGENVAKQITIKANASGYLKIENKIRKK